MEMFREARLNALSFNHNQQTGLWTNVKKNNHQILIEDPVSYNMYVQRKKVRLSLQQATYFFCQYFRDPKKKVKKGLAVRNIGKNVYILNCKISPASISVAPVLVTDLFMYSGTEGPRDWKNMCCNNKVSSYSRRTPRNGHQLKQKGVKDRLITGHT